MPWWGLDLDKLTPVQSRVAHAMYALGFTHGHDRGWDARDEAAAADWAPIVRFIRGLGLPSSRTYTELEELRRDTSSGRPVPTVAECAASWHGTLRHPS